MLCVWTKDEWADTWETGCGNAFVFNDEGPTENGFKFCPYCGKSVLVKITDTKEPPDADA